MTVRTASAIALLPVIGLAWALGSYLLDWRRHRRWLASWAADVARAEAERRALAAASRRRP